jgi:hypothetical protein
VSDKVHGEPSTLRPHLLSRGLVQAELEDATMLLVVDVFKSEAFRGAELTA